MAQITGSRAYERFSGPQIAKVYREEESAYFNTEVREKEKLHTFDWEKNKIVFSVELQFVWVILQE